ncbi:MAG TPA: uracil-DNA glycosylase [Elusimicrobiota bacterium]|nr:uracil-DNA glycosylase [Elusimicrobiota bacterium]
MTTRREILREARQLVEQERVWGEAMLAAKTADGDAGKAGHAVSAPSPSPAAVSASNPPIAAAEASPKKTEDLARLYERYKDCVRCSLGRTRIKFVFGVGSPDAPVLFIGEGPGYEEDRRGEPFVGKAGQLLDKIMASIGLSRQTNAYIANIVKCHPMANPQTPEARGNDRPPSPEEVETCSPILLEQIAILQPRVIVTLGSPSTRMILKTKDGITQLRGRFFPFAVDAFYPERASDAELFGSGEQRRAQASPKISPTVRERLRQIQVLPTYHPAALLRNPNLKPETWTDMKLLRDTLAKPPAAY